jgi:hypothetical protein
MGNCAFLYLEMSVKQPQQLPVTHLLGVERMFYLIVFFDL